MNSIVRSVRPSSDDRVVVVHPDDPDRQEARGVGEVRRPEVEELGAEVVMRALIANSSTSSVAAIANTPSLNASRRPVPGSTAGIVADAADGSS